MKSKKECKRQRRGEGESQGEGGTGTGTEDDLFGYDAGLGDLFDKGPTTEADLFGEKNITD